MTEAADPAPRRPRNAAATRQLILDHARELFAQHGYGATTVKAVAAAAAVSPNLITRYFGGILEQPGYEEYSASAHERQEIADFLIDSMQRRA